MWEPQVGQQAAVTLSAASAGQQCPAPHAGQMLGACLQPDPSLLGHPAPPRRHQLGLVFMAVGPQAPQLV